MITVEIEGAAVQALFERKARFAGNFMAEIGREALDVVKRDVQGEIRGQYYLAGGRQKWPITVQIGRLPAGRPALQHFAREWENATPRVSASEAELRVSIPGGGAHVGGEGTQRGSVGQRTVIKPLGTPRAMQGAIYAKTGAWISSKKLESGLELPARPHANPDNPVTARGVEQVMARKLEGA